MEYDLNSRKQESKFVSDVLTELRTQTNISSEQLVQNERDIKKKIQYLEKLGFELNSDDNNVEYKKLSDDMRSMIDTYQRDIIEKLKIFDEDDLSNKLNKYMEIINDLFDEKTIHFSSSWMKISSDSPGGIYFSDSKLSPSQYTISPNNLSSGEQNALVLFYNLIFGLQSEFYLEEDNFPLKPEKPRKKIKSNVLVLIDEPEISLHLFWKFKFVDKLNEIIQKFYADQNVEFIIATHSSAIIRDREMLVQYL